jgi:GH24 family phage-related lysozyme (muramidase)
MTKPQKFLALIVGGFLLYDYIFRSPADGSTQGILIDLRAKLNNAMGNQTMKTSQAGLDAIRNREGTVYTVYDDGFGYLTGGTGHKLTPAELLTFSAGDAIAPGLVEQWFAQDVAHAENIVNNYVTCSLTQNEFDALISMTFNLGGQLWTNSNGTATGINKALSAGDTAAAAEQILRWNKPAAIIARRTTEYNQFLA